MRRRLRLKGEREVQGSSVSVWFSGKYTRLATPLSPSSTLLVQLDRRTPSTSREHFESASLGLAHGSARRAFESSSNSRKHKAGVPCSPSNAYHLSAPPIPSAQSCFAFEASLGRVGRQLAAYRALRERCAAHQQLCSCPLVQYISSQLQRSVSLKALPTQPLRPQYGKQSLGPRTRLSPVDVAKQKDSPDMVEAKDTAVLLLKAELTLPTARAGEAGGCCLRRLVEAGGGGEEGRGKRA